MRLPLTPNRRFVSDAICPALRAYARAPQPERYTAEKVYEWLKNI
jgi:hypothetical protein